MVIKNLRITDDQMVIIQRNKIPAAGLTNYQGCFRNSFIQDRMEVTNSHKFIRTEDSYQKDIDLIMTSPEKHARYFGIKLYVT